MYGLIRHGQITEPKTSREFVIQAVAITQEGEERVMVQQSWDYLSHAQQAQSLQRDHEDPETGIRYEFRLFSRRVIKHEWELHPRPTP